MANRSYPESPEQFDEATDAAVFSLGVDAAWKYGLIEPDPKVDVARCEEIIAEARKRGLIIHTLDEVLAAVKGNKAALSPAEGDASSGSADKGD